ncbi:hypothetical protein HBI25_155470 [Parastagonospora nodorum]|nr:hypothetical protein HBH92_198790 [Parastagonospora nodorum]KAH4421233.1 hypothetical protein HBH93_200960 [Parastagonospora nodorum]KAH4434076.1 hypothetical protein HBH91_211400 [Parastagonospora nodorum]KAH4500048.1 hypothetical protein HBH89_120750 [Parastagonospora nodorum]KAH4528791.1 hypothetical protein HBH85_202510 [Parastagonospora nodorum]
MQESSYIISAAVQEAFSAFVADGSALALALTLTDGTLQPSAIIRSKCTGMSLQAVLNELDAIIDPRTPLYLLLRRNEKLVAITFVPYLAKESERAILLEHRHYIVKTLGQEHFSQSLICKEVGEVTDARSWTERDEDDFSPEATSKHARDVDACDNVDCEICSLRDLGYKRNKCRLCDRRMKNKITPEALDALSSLKNTGAVVQISVNITTDTLILTLSQSDIQPHSISSLLPTASPSFTFYHHPELSMVYFIFHSPDTATVQQRMKHTMAIPGLLVHAEDAGILVDRKIEIHEPDELDFGAGKDGRVGRFRSMYRREGFSGTELMYEGMVRDKEFLDAV